MMQILGIVYLVLACLSPIFGLVLYTERGEPWF